MSRLGTRQPKETVNDKRPFPIQAATDPTVGYTAAELSSLSLLSGTAYAHPKYSNFTDVDHWNDVGVIVLDAPVRGKEPASLTPLHYLDSFMPPKLRKTLFTTVGYGTEVRKLEPANQ